MSMVFCRGCGKNIHESAKTCPFCGAVQHATINPANVDGTLWMSITSLIFGVLCALALLDDSVWDKDTILGLGIFSVASIVLGVISISKQKRGKGMAVAGIILSSLAFLVMMDKLS